MEIIHETEANQILIDYSIADLPQAWVWPWHLYS